MIKGSLILVLFFTSSAIANEELKQLSFLEGCWKGSIDGSTVYESWGNSDGQMMLGASKTVSKGSIETFEFLSILPLEGKIQYVPYVNGKKSVSFQLGQSNGSLAEFSNSAHDFPKNIRYERQGSELTIRLSGDGQDMTYTLNQVNCSVP